MPHFSPISWLITGFVFYFLLMGFVSLFWWMQSYKLPFNLGVSSFNLNFMWKWL